MVQSEKRLLYIYGVSVKGVKGLLGSNGSCSLVVIVFFVFFARWLWLLLFGALAKIGFWLLGFSLEKFWTFVRNNLSSFAMDSSSSSLDCFKPMPIYIESMLDKTKGERNGIICDVGAQRRVHDKDSFALQPSNAAIKCSPSNTQRHTLRHTQEE